MTDGGVVITFGANDAEVQRVLQNMQKGYEKLIDQNKRLKEETTRANKEVKDQASAISNQISQIASMATGFISVQAAAALVTKELQAQYEQQKKISDLQDQAAGGEALFLRALGGGVSSSDRQALLSQLRQISKESGVSYGTVAAAGANALNAKGSLTEREALAALAQAARIAPENQQELSATAGGLLDIASLTKTADPRQNTGYLSVIAEQTRIRDLERINTNLIPAAIGVSGYGGSSGESAALVTTLTSAMKDITGAQSGTSSIRLAQQLAEFLPTEDTYETDPRTGRKRRLRGGTGMTETDERIRYLQERPELRDQFMQQGSWEAQARMPIQSLLTRGSESANLFERNIQGFGGDLAGTGESWVRSLRDSQLQRHADASRRGFQVAESVALQNPQAGAAGQVGKMMNEFRENRNDGYVAPWAYWMEMQGSSFLHSMTGGRLGATKTDTAIAQLEKEKSFARGGDTTAIDEMLGVLRQIQANTAGGKNIDRHTE